MKTDEKATPTDSPKRLGILGQALLLVQAIASNNLSGGTSHFFWIPTWPILLASCKPPCQPSWSCSFAPCHICCSHSIPEPTTTSNNWDNSPVPVVSCHDLFWFVLPVISWGRNLISGPTHRLGCGNLHQALGLAAAVLLTGWHAANVVAGTSGVVFRAPGSGECLWTSAMGQNQLSYKYIQCVELMTVWPVFNFFIIWDTSPHLKKG